MPDTQKGQHWSLESLTKAYQQGYMAGLAGNAADAQPFDASVLAAAWEAGWVDGDGQRRISEEKRSQSQPPVIETKKRA